MKMGEEDSNTKPHKPCDAATSSSSSAEEDFNTLSAEDRMKITAPRKITNDEVLALCKLMKNEFNVVDEETDDDADALLEYAVDIIDGGKSVDMVMKELKAMEISVFDTTTSPKVSLILSKYLHNLMHTPPPINNETIVKSTTPQRQQVDLSPYTSPKKSRLEVKPVQTSSPSLMLLADNYRKRASISSADVGLGESEDLDDSMMNLEQQYSSGGSHSSNKVDFDNLNTTQRMEVKASRKLETSESMGLYKLMKAQLNIVNDDDDADADTLLLYALDMVNGGDTVGAVIEEIDLMEMSVCDAEAAQNVALVLSKFLYYLRSSTSDVIDVTSTAMASKNRDELQLLRSSAQSLRVLTDNYIRRVTSASSLLTMDLEDSDDPVRSGDGGIDLSARAATKKNRDEVQFIRKSSTSSLKEKSDSYLRRVTSASSLLTMDLEDSDDPVRYGDGGIDLSARAATKKNRDEAHFIRKSSTSSLKQKSDNYIRRLPSASSFLTMDLEDSDDPVRYDDGGIDLSARAATKKNRDEVQFIRKSSTSSLKEKSDSYLRRVTSASSLLTMDLEDSDDPVRYGDGGIDLSARAATKKNRDEVQFIRKSSTSSLKQKSDNYIRRVPSASSFLTMDLEDSDDPVRYDDGGIDLSARAATKKNRDEVQFIRKSSTSSLKQKSESYIRRTSASSFSSADLGDVDDSVRSGDGEIDVSAQAMTRRYRDEVQFLRPSMANLKERTDNYKMRALNSSAGGEPDDLDISDYFDRGHLSSSNRDFDALSMAERMDVTACRALTTSETMTLYKMMKAKLNVVDDESDEDADTLLDYAFDMMDEGESVGMVVKELEMMGMSVCDADAALKVALVLSKYLYYLRDSFEAKVDLSPHSLKKKCRDEVQSLRSNTESLETRIQNYSKRASVSGSPRERDVLGDDEQKDQKSTADVDLSALAAAKKHWNELEELSTRLNFEEKMEKYRDNTSRNKMYFTSGNVVTRSGQDRDCESKSVSTTDIRCTDEGFIDVDGVFDPKQLDEEATSSLRQLLQAQLSTNSDSSEQQVSDVLDYTIDLVSSQNNIGTVIKELEFLQMDLFNANVANKFGKCLSEFLLSMERTSAESDDAKRRKELQAIMHDSSLGKKERAKKMEEVKQNYLAKSGNVTVEKASVDLSALAASKKHLSELMSLQVDGLPQQKEAIYSETGELKHWGRDSDAQNETKSIDLQRRNELQVIMRDKSLGKDDRARKMKEVKQKYLEKTGVVDLSATAAAKKHHNELKSLPVSNMKQQKSAIYSETGELRHWAKSGTNDKPDDGALDLSTRKYQAKVDLDPDSRRKDLFNTNYEKKPSLDSQRREELQMIMQDKSLGKVERAKKIEEVKQTYVTTTETERGTRTSENEPVNLSAMAAAEEHQCDLEFLTTGVVDLSATAAAKKHHNELKSLPVSNMKQQKSAIYSETGELRHWAKSGTNDKPDDGALDLSTRKYQDKVDLDPDSRRKDLFNTNYEKKPSLDSQRREELQMIMQDKSLGKVERAKKIEEVKQKYVTTTETERGTRTSENEPVNLSAMAEHQNDLQFLTMSVLEKDDLKQPKTALYSETGELKQWRNDDDIDNKKTKKVDGIDVSTKKYAEIMKYDPDSKRKEYYDNQFLTKLSLGSRRRDELQAIMQDKSLGKEERVRKMEEVKRKYVVQVETELDIMRSKELQDIVKEKSVGKGERVKRMKEVKLKYEQKLQMLI